MGTNGKSILKVDYNVKNEIENMGLMWGKKTTVSQREEGIKVSIAVAKKKSGINAETKVVGNKGIK